MAKVTRIDRPACKVIREVLNKALAQVGSDLGLEIKTGNASYDPDGANAVFKIDINLAGGDNREMAEARRMMELYDIDKTTASFAAGRRKKETWEIVGYKPRSRKAPWLLRNENGTVYKFGQHTIDRHFKSTGKTKLGVELKVVGNDRFPGINN